MRDIPKPPAIPNGTLADTGLGTTLSNVVR
jgi:hypothetical protein